MGKAQRSPVESQTAVSAGLWGGHHSVSANTVIIGLSPATSAVKTGFVVVETALKLTCDGADGRDREFLRDTTSNSAQKRRGRCDHIKMSYKRTGRSSLISVNFRKFCEIRPHGVQAGVLKFGD